jgi:polysaccharide biosynthesis transport protein
MRRVDSTALENQLYGRDFLEGINNSELRAIGDVFRAIYRSRYLIAVAALVGVTSGFVLAKVLPEEFTSTARVMIDTRVQGDGGITAADSILPISLTSLESEAEVLRSLDLVERVIDTLGLQDDPEFMPDEDEQPVATDPVDRDAPPEETSFIGDAIESARSLASALLSGTAPEDALPPDSVGAADLDAILEKQKVVQIVAEQLSVEQLSSVSAVYSISFTSLDRQKAALIANTFAEQYLASQLQTKLDALDRSTGWLTGRARELNARLAELNSQFETHMLGAPFPAEEDLVNARTQRNRLLVRLGQAQNSGAAGANISQIESALGQLNDALAEQGRFEAESSRLENEIEVTTSIYSNVVAQLSTLQQQDNILRTDAQIISTARPSVWPSAPNRNLLMVIGGVSGLFLASLAAAVAELRQRNLRSVSDFVEATGLPVISLIPKSGGRETPLRTLMRGGVLRDSRLPKSARKLRSAIVASGRDQQVIAIVSAFPGEGKSSTALLLAQACAHAGEQTLLLDLDFWRSPYRSAVRRDSPGMNQVISSPEQLDDFLLTLGKGFDILPALPNTEEPSELPYSKQFSTFLAFLRARYERIVIDMPPVLPMLDFATMANAADISLLVVRWNSTPRSAVISALRNLQDVGVMPFAVVPTLVQANRAHTYSDDAFSYADRRYHSGYAD